MIYPIIIGSHPGDPFLKECIDSLRGMPCAVIVNDGYEPAKLKEVIHHTKYESFLFIPSTVRFKIVNWIPRLWLEFPDQGVSLSSHPCPFGSFMGKYRREVLEKIIIPQTVTKVAAVHAERTMSEAYCTIEKPFEFFTDLHDREEFEMHHGQKRMVIQNEFLTKLKATWSMELAEEIDRNAPHRQ